MVKINYNRITVYKYICRCFGHVHNFSSMGERLYVLYSAYAYQKLSSLQQSKSAFNLLLTTSCAG